MRARMNCPGAMNTFLGLLAWMGAEGAAGGAMPTTGTRLSVLSMELPHGITPTLAGLTVGAVVGVLGFIAVLLLAGRGSRRGPVRRAPGPMTAGQVVFIPPYQTGMLQRDTPLPPAAFVIPGQLRAAPGSFAPPRAPYGHGPVLPFRPSTDLSARAFAKMGYQSEADDGDSPSSDPELFIECETLFEDESDLIPAKTYAPPPPAAVSVSAILVVEEAGDLRAADKSAPHPLGIISSSSSAMRAASFADLEMDDGATEIGETYFDEPPQPRRRTDPPKIRAIAPAGPRFPAATQHLPQPTPPPMRAVASLRG